MTVDSNPTDNQDSLRGGHLVVWDKEQSMNPTFMENYIIGRKMIEASVRVIAGKWSHVTAEIRLLVS